MKILSTSNINATKTNMLIYGESGVGKTVLASTLDAPTLIISLESGLLSLKKHKIDYIEVGNITELRKTLSEAQKSNYSNIYIDSLSSVSDLFFDYSKEKYPEDRQTMKLYGNQLEMMTKFIRYCRDIDKNIFFTSLEKTTTDEIGRRFKVPDLHGSISIKAPQYFDFVFNYQIVKKDEEEKRFLITNKTEKSICKDRSGMLDKYSPPHLQQIMDKVFKEA